MKPLHLDNHPPRRRTPTATLAATLAAVLTACGSPAPQPVEIVFEARVGDALARCDAPFEGVGSGATTVQVSDARFYVSGLSRVRADGSREPITLEQGSPWQFQDVALLDFEDGTGRCSEVGTRELNDVVRGTVPGTRGGEGFVGLAFEIGVPEALNHLDVTSAPSPLNLVALYWSWQLGHIFTKVDFWLPDAQVPSETGLTSALGADPAAAVRPNLAYLAHVGSTGCESPARTQPPSAPCARPNRVPVTLPAFDPSAQVVVLDLAAWVAGIDLSRSVPRPPGCMSGADDPDCAPLFANLGLDITTGRCRTDCADQKLVRTAPRLRRPGAPPP